MTDSANCTVWGVTYCGAAPGEIIYQLNFVYPSGVAASGVHCYGNDHDQRQHQQHFGARRLVRRKSPPATKDPFLLPIQAASGCRMLLFAAACRSMANQSEVTATKVSEKAGSCCISLSFVAQLAFVGSFW